MKVRHWAALCLLFLVGAALFASGCSGNMGGEPLGWAEQALQVPTRAECSIRVLGHGVLSLESNYIPHVITCEDGGAGLQALEAQAIAARSVAYYAIKNNGYICDGQSCQVYSCGRAPSANAKKAARVTAGMVLAHNGTLTYGFYVAGDAYASPPSCRDHGGATSWYVTYNWGRTGRQVHQTPLGYEGPPGYGQNRGCMSQDGARCLESHKHFNMLQILRFYYGSDIRVAPTHGSCVPDTKTLKARAVRKWSNAKRFHGRAADYLVCAGQKFKFTFTFKNTGTAVWRDVNGRGSSVGSDVFLVTTSGKKDRLTGHRHYSVQSNKNSQVHGNRAAPNCNTHNGCRQTTFVRGGMIGHAPNKPGIYKSRWRLRDFSKHWGSHSHGFGPKVQLKLKVVSCKMPSGGCGCRVWCSNGKSQQLSSSIQTPTECTDAARQFCRASQGNSSLFVTKFNACPVPLSGSAGASNGGAGGASSNGGAAGATGSGGATSNGNGGAAGASLSSNGIDIAQSGASSPVQDDPGYSDYGFNGDSQSADQSGCSVAAAGHEGGAPLEISALMLLFGVAEVRRRASRKSEATR